jgi:hypothetical protein
VDFLLYAANLDASVATRSKISANRVREAKQQQSDVDVPLTKEFRIDIARLEIPVSG